MGDNQAILATVGHEKAESGLLHPDSAYCPDYGSAQALGCTFAAELVIETAGGYLGFIAQALKPAKSE